MDSEQKQIEKCPVCNCTFGSNHLYLDWIVTLKSENGYVPLFRYSGCYSPFYVKRENGSLTAYLGNTTD